MQLYMLSLFYRSMDLFCMAAVTNTANVPENNTKLFFGQMKLRFDYYLIYLPKSV